ncbi:hypothetical protein HIM_07327 [Hirsutella minnesotensis 3608]|uniref:Uncharacterized protein n=1 Tax=Hirsutella minnesotensis 3608 TaxID=1043627 RepID=A0A0F7ZTL5_9HYPO|nr:hypothetical protein HIM_07327 [Hirsutella minnesotensis 3608]
MFWYRRKSPESCKGGFHNIEERAGQNAKHLHDQHTQDGHLLPLMRDIPSQASRVTCSRAQRRIKTTGCADPPPLQETALRNIDKVPKSTSKQPPQTTAKELHDALAGLPEIPKNLPEHENLPELSSARKHAPKAGIGAGSKSVPVRETVPEKREEPWLRLSARETKTQEGTCQELQGRDALLGSALARLKASLLDPQSPVRPETSWESVQQELDGRQFSCE